MWHLKLQCLLESIYAPWYWQSFLCSQSCQFFSPPKFFKWLIPSEQGLLFIFWFSLKLIPHHCPTVWSNHGHSGESFSLYSSVDFPSRLRAPWVRLWLSSTRKLHKLSLAPIWLHTVSSPLSPLSLSSFRPSLSSPGLLPQPPNWSLSVCVPTHR